MDIHIKPVHGQVYVWTAVFCILLGGLGSLTANIVLFSAVFAVYSLGDIWGQRLRNEQIRPAFQKAREEALQHPEVLARIAAVERYYFEKPQLERSATIMFFSFSSLALALVGKTSVAPFTADLLLVIAYLLIIANIVVSEVVIWSWRKERDRVLGETYSF